MSTVFEQYVTSRERVERLTVVGPQAEADEVRRQLTAAGYRIVRGGPYTDRTLAPDCDPSRFLFLCERPEDGTLAEENGRLRTEVEAQKKRADGWMEHAGSLRCQKCSHPHGRLGVPKGLVEDGYTLVWSCPCDCHADVPAMREENGQLRRALAAILAPARDLLALIRDPGDDGGMRLLGIVSDRPTCAALDLLRAALPAAEEALRGGAEAVTNPYEESTNE